MHKLKIHSEDIGSLRDSECRAMHKLKIHSEDIGSLKIMDVGQCISLKSIQKRLDH